jgi:hypothetical protein
MYVLMIVKNYRRWHDIATCGVVEELVEYHQF